MRTGRCERHYSRYKPVIHFIYVCEFPYNLFKAPHSIQRKLGSNATRPRCAKIFSQRGSFRMPSKMADHETVLLEVINTKHKKTGGTLRLMSNELLWIPYGSDHPKLSCAYSEIKGKIDQPI